MMSTSTLSSSAATRAEAIVIGAGVIGLAVARALSVSGLEVILIDRASSIGSETSSRNSEVIHGGLYYPNESLKARFCVRGRELMYEFCQKRSIIAKKCGKLVVAEASNKDKLKFLYEQALQNGVSDVELLSPVEVTAMEPTIQATGGALWSPSTGILDVHSFMMALLHDAESAGTTLALRTKVVDAVIDNEIRILAGDIWLTSGLVINCAGLWADEIAAKMHRAESWRPPRQYFCKGNYFTFSGQTAPFKHLIYPLPDKGGGLGIHATIDIGGKVKFGPDVEWLDPGIRPDDIDMQPNSARKESFYGSIRTYWPELQDEVLVPDYAGIRPKLSHPTILGGESRMSHPFSDFFIADPTIHGIAGLVHLLGMESPGLTSSLALAEYIACHILPTVQRKI